MVLIESSLALGYKSEKNKNSAPLKMAPKNVSVSNPPQKVVKKRVPKTKLTKPPLKAPKCITEKIPNLGKPPRITRKVSKKQKIELANEVALNQLAKPLETRKPPQSPLAKLKLPTKTITLPICSKIKPAPRKRKYSSILASQDSNSDSSPVKSKAKPTQCEESACKPKRVRKHLQGKVVECENNTQVGKTFWSVQIDEETPLKSRLKKISDSKVTSDEIEHDLSVTKQVSVIKATKKPNKNPEQKVISDYFLDKPTNGATVVPKEVPKTPVKRVRKRTPKKPKVETKGPTANVFEENPTKKTKGRPTKAKIDLHKQLTAKTEIAKTDDADEIKTAALMLEDNLKKGTEVVVNRAESVTSNQSCLSWTRDVSTESDQSSTTTFVSVATTDFFRFDKKLPIVQVENTLDRIIENDMETSPVESSTSTSDAKKSEPSSPTSYDDSIGNPTLNLSTTSLTSESSRAAESTMLMHSEFTNIIKSLNQFNAEISKWGFVHSEDDSDGDDDILSRISRATKGINSNSISDDDNIKMNKEASPENRSIESRRETVIRNDIEFSRASDAPHSPDDDISDPYAGLSTTSSNKSFQREKFPVNVHDNLATPTALQEPRPSRVDGSSGSSETFTSDNYNYVSFEDNDDTLSLFAESFSGMDSHSKLSTDASVQEPFIPKPVPYVPEPRTPLLLERYSYRPTRINDGLQKASVPAKTIQPDMVNIQNADSSSICKETNINGKVAPLMQLAAQPSSLAAAVETSNQQIRVFPRYQAINPVRSSLYKNYCFFHLASQCIKIHCRFPHLDIDINTLKCRLSVLSEDNLIEEYLLTRNYVALRRKYGLLFMQECKRRAATRLLMEMNVDLGLGMADRLTTLNNEALDITLLHLNQISLDACDDWLIFSHNGALMCDTLIARVADSQNLAQFKDGFVKLANFMAQIKRPVNADKVKTIVERVCLLPCDESLVRGAVCLMINTDPRLFDDPITYSFEVQLSNVPSDVGMPYELAKKEAECRAAARLCQPAPSEPARASPDTTHLDSLIKAQMAQPTTFKRTINTDALFKSPMRPAPKLRYRNNKGWRGRSPMPFNMRGGPRPRMPTGRIVGTPVNY